MSPTRRFRALAFACASTFLFPISASAANIAATWTDAGTLPFWNTVQNWSSSPNYPNNGTPAGTTYDVTISNTPAFGYADLNINATINFFTLSGGELIAASTASSLTVSNVFTWSGGHIGDGNGNGITINANSGVLMNGDADKTIGGRNFPALVNASGTSYWVNGNIVGNGINSANMFVFHNTAGSNFNVFATNNNTFSAQLINDGAMIVNSGTTNPVTFARTFTGSGTVSITGGTMVLAPAFLASTSNGLFNLSSGAALQFMSTLGTAGSMTGLGAVLLGGAAAGCTINGSYSVGNTILLSTITTTTDLHTLVATVQSGGFTGATGSFNVTAKTTFLGSFFTASVPFNANGGMDFASNSNMAPAGSYFVNGPSTWSGTGSIEIGGGGTINLTFGPNALFTIPGDRLLDDPLNTGGNVITNQGQIYKTAGAGNLNLLVKLTNSGLLESDSGTIQIQNVPANSGTIRANGGSIQISGTINNAGGTLDDQPNSNLRFALVTGGTLHVGGTTTISGTSFSHISFSKLQTLTIDGAPNAWTGHLDLSFSGMILPTAGDAAKTSLLATLDNQVHSGANGGTWTGPGITSSAISTFSPKVYTLGIFDNAVLGKTTFGTAPFTQTQSADASCIVLSLAHLGDANDSGIVDIQDQSIVTNHWQSTQPAWSTGDLNFDGFIDLQDLTLVTNNWQQSSTFTLDPSDSSARDLAVSSVPEPSTLSLLALASLGLTRRRPLFRTARSI